MALRDAESVIVKVIRALDNMSMVELEGSGFQGSAVSVGYLPTYIREGQGEGRRQRGKVAMSVAQKSRKQTQSPKAEVDGPAHSL